MGYQPALDGLRAISVVAVLLYHAGFSWMHGGFFGVEVFFVVSGFLITSLLLDERQRTGRIDFGQFWLRRARRLFPALFAVIAAVAVWTALWGTAEQVSQVRRDVPWAVFYLGNWGQILGDVPYFAGEPPLLRHLWSLAVEEQWYLFWPVIFVGLTAVVRSTRSIGWIVLGGAVGVWVLTAWMESGSPALLGGPPGLFDGADRTNFMYLSTLTRAGGLLLGAAAAFLWRPWRSRNAARAPVGSVLDPLAAGAVALLVCIFAVATLVDGYVYRWLLPAVSILSVVAVMVAVHPAAVGFRRMMSVGWLVEVGKRSYGLYLWSWPISVIVGATHGSVSKFLLAMAITAVVAEVSYRFLEIPIRRGEWGGWWRRMPRHALAPLAGGAMLLVSVVTFYAVAEPYDPFTGGEEATFDANALSADPSSEPMAGASGGASPAIGQDGGPATAADDDPIATTAPPTAAAETATLAIVGDSQANALEINLPDGIESAFPVVYNGSVDGCGVFDAGRVRSAITFNNDFAICEGWQDDWAYAAKGADVALVVIGAWDVFDLEVDDTTYPFASPEFDERFSAGLRSGIDAMLAEGVNVGLLEVPCMRPVDVAGAGVPALPERGDDGRVAHVNDLLSDVADGYDDSVQVVDGPDEWCADEAIATDLGYRWDGVHVYQPGAKLIMEAVATQLLELAAV
jgi:peptidoglycan/LPS O-acetylase OafA/YrhL